MFTFSHTAAKATAVSRVVGRQRSGSRETPKSLQRFWQFAAANSGGNFPLEAKVTKAKPKANTPRLNSADLGLSCCLVHSRFI